VAGPPAAGVAARGVAAIGVALAGDTFVVATPRGVAAIGVAAIGVALAGDVFVTGVTGETGVEMQLLISAPPLQVVLQLGAPM